MANKLKKVFSDEIVPLSGKIHFQDHASYKKFIEALKLVQGEGKTVKVDGVTSIETSVKNGDSEYPFLDAENIVDLIVKPSIEKVPFELDTEYGKKVLNLDRYYTDRAVVLTTDENAIVYLKLTFEKETMKSKLTYRAQPQLANTIREVLEAYSTVLAFFERLFRQDALDRGEEYSFIRNMKEYFVIAIARYHKLEIIGQEFGIEIKPVRLEEDEESLMDLEELWILLKEKKAVRLNAKLTETEGTGFEVNQPEENIKPGSPLDITFANQVIYSLWGQQVMLYTANLLSNAIVKEIREMEDSKVRILYGDEDIRPMYISYRGFRTEEEAQEELKTLMEHKEMYAEALTMSGYMNSLAEK